jgi:hypothetical protein
MMDKVAEAVTNWLTTYPEWVLKEFKLTLEDHPGSPWLNVRAEKVGPYFAADGPGSYDFSVWRATGAVYRVVDGEVKEPELFRVEP